MAIAAIERQKTGKRWCVLTDEEKAEVMRAIDEYDFVSVVLRHKAALMPEDLVRELTRQNDMNRETIMQVMGKDRVCPIHLVQSV